VGLIRLPDRTGMARNLRLILDFLCATDARVDYRQDCVEASGLRRPRPSEWRLGMHFANVCSHLANAGSACCSK